jgi:hypothetical protein
VTHDSIQVTFIYESALAPSQHAFKLFFSYYEPYTDDQVDIRNAGVYIFKTKNVKDSLKYPHKIVKVEADRKGGEVQQIVITYEDELREKAYVKVKLREGVAPVEFDVHFSGLTQHDMEAIINFESLDIVNKEGSFFTDSNGLGIVKRNRKRQETGGVIENFLSDAPVNYYPINKCLMIEDHQRQMLIMNDRPQGGSGYRGSRLELMFNRRVSSHDDLGMPENLNEFARGAPIKTNHRYYLLLTEDRKELFKIYKQFSSQLTFPLQYFQANIDFSLPTDPLPPKLLMIQRNYQLARQAFADFLTAHGVLEFQMMPNYD